MKIHDKHTNSFLIVDSSQGYLHLNAQVRTQALLESYLMSFALIGGLIIWRRSNKANKESATTVKTISTPKHPGRKAN